MARTRLYRNGVLEAKDFPVADVSDHLEDPSSVVWVDVCEPDQSDLDAIAEELQLHALAVEDAVNEHQRPKLDRYRSHLFVTGYSVRLDEATGRLETAEVAAFVTPQALVTVRKSPDFDIDEIEGLEDMLFDEAPRSREVQQRSFQLRKSLVLLRRVVVPMREVVNALMRRDLHVVDDAMTPYYQDVYDHVLRATEWTESLRDLVTTILETHLTIQGNRLNSIMKK